MSVVVDSSDMSEKEGEEEEKIIIIIELPLVGWSCLPYEHRDIP